MTGHTRHAQIVDAVCSDRQVAHVLANLEQLRIVDRVVPVTDDPRVRDLLSRKAAGLPSVAEGLRFAVAARRQVCNLAGVLRVTAVDIFS